MERISELAGEIDRGEIIASVELAAGLAASRRLGRRLDARLDPTGVFSFSETAGAGAAAGEPAGAADPDSGGAAPPAEDLPAGGAEAARFLKASRDAARAAREVLHARLRDARILSRAARYQKRIGRLETGAVARREGKDLIVNLGPVEGRLPVSEQSRHEIFNEGDLVRAVVAAVRPEEPPVILSRTAPEVVSGVMERETPAIRNGEVSVRRVARLPGLRAKAAVSTDRPSVNPVAACLGHRGATIRAVTRELRGERVDVLLWSDSTEAFVSNALGPARVLSVELGPDEGGATVTVSEAELPRALGKRGQNVRLASELTGLRIEIVVEGQPPRRRRGARPPGGARPSGGFRRPGGFRQSGRRPGPRRPRPGPGGPQRGRRRQAPRRPRDGRPARPRDRRSGS